MVLANNNQCFYLLLIVNVKYLKRLSILSLQFYKLLFWYNVAFTIVALIVLQFGAIPINAVSFAIAKLAGYLIAVGLHYYNSKNHYFYFRNTGYSMRWIFIGALFTDILVYLIIALICLN